MLAFIHIHICEYIYTHGYTCIYIHGILHPHVPQEAQNDKPSATIGIGAQASRGKGPPRQNGLACVCISGGLCLSRLGIPT